MYEYCKTSHFSEKTKLNSQPNDHNRNIVFGFLFKSRLAQALSEYFLFFMSVVHHELLNLLVCYFVKQSITCHDDEHVLQPIFNHAPFLVFIQIERSHLWCCKNDVFLQVWFVESDFHLRLFVLKISKLEIVHQVVHKFR